MTDLGFAVCPIHPVLLADSQQNHNRLYIWPERRFMYCFVLGHMTFVWWHLTCLFRTSCPFCGQSYDFRILSSTIVISIDPSIYSSRPNTIHPAAPLFYLPERKASVPPGCNLPLLRLAHLPRFTFCIISVQYCTYLERLLAFLPKRITANKI